MEVTEEHGAGKDHALPPFLGPRGPAPPSTQTQRFPSQSPILFTLILKHMIWGERTGLRGEEVEAIEDSDGVQDKKGTARMDGPSLSALHGLPRIPGQRQRCSLLQDLDLDTANPMSPASPATPRAMPPTMAMPTSPSGEKREIVRSRPPAHQDPGYYLLPTHCSSTDVPPHLGVPGQGILRAGQRRLLGV